jgi:NarL family two-component system response regulator YdfI
MRKCLYVKTDIFFEEKEGGIEQITYPQSIYCRRKSIYLTTFNDDQLVLRGLRAGACGYLLEDCDLEILLTAIRRMSQQ